MSQQQVKVKEQGKEESFLKEADAKDTNAKSEAGAKQQEKSFGDVANDTIVKKRKLEGALKEIDGNKESYPSADKLFVEGHKFANTSERNDSILDDYKNVLASFTEAAQQCDAVINENKNGSISDGISNISSGADFSDKESEIDKYVSQQSTSKEELTTIQEKKHAIEEEIESKKEDIENLEGSNDNADKIETLKNDLINLEKEREKCEEKEAELRNKYLSEVQSFAQEAESLLTLGGDIEVNVKDDGSVSVKPNNNTSLVAYLVEELVRRGAKKDEISKVENIGGSDVLVLDSEKVISLINTQVHSIDDTKATFEKEISDAKALKSGASQEELAKLYDTIGEGKFRIFVTVLPMLVGKDGLFPSDDAVSEALKGKLENIKKATELPANEADGPSLSEVGNMVKGKAMGLVDRSVDKVKGEAEGIKERGTAVIKDSVDPEDIQKIKEIKKDPKGFVENTAKKAVDNIKGQANEAIQESLGEDAQKLKEFKDNPKEFIQKTTKDVVDNVKGQANEALEESLGKEDVQKLKEFKDNPKEFVQKTAKGTIENVKAEANSVLEESLGKEDTEKLKEFKDNPKEFVKNTATGAVNKLKSEASSVVEESLGDDAKKLKEFSEDPEKFIKKNAEGLVENVKEQAGSVVEESLGKEDSDKLKNIAKELRDNPEEFVSEKAKGVLDEVKGQAGSVVGEITSGKDVINNIASNVTSEAKGAVGNLNISNTVQNIKDQASSAIGEATTSGKDVVKGLTSDINNGAKEIANVNISDTIQNSKDQASSLVENLPIKEIVQGGTEAVNGVKDNASNLLQSGLNVKEVLQTQPEAVVEKLQDEGNIQKAADSIVNIVNTTGSAAADQKNKEDIKSAEDIISNLKSNASTFLKDKSQQAEGLAANAGTIVEEKIQKAENIVTDLKDNAQKAGDFVNNIGSNATTFVQDKVQKAGSVVDNISSKAESFANNASTLVENNVQKVESLATNAGAKAKDMATNATAFVGDKVQKVENLATNAGAKAKDMATNATAFVGDKVQKVENLATNAGAKAKDMATNASAFVEDKVQKVESLASNVVGRAENMATNAGEFLQDKAGKAGDLVNNLSARAGNMVNDAEAFIDKSGKKVEKIVTNAGSFLMDESGNIINTAEGIAKDAYGVATDIGSTVIDTASGMLKYKNSDFSSLDVKGRDNSDIVLKGNSSKRMKAAKGMSAFAEMAKKTSKETGEGNSFVNKGVNKLVDYKKGKDGDNSENSDENDTTAEDSTQSASDAINAIADIAGIAGNASEISYHRDNMKNMSMQSVSVLTSLKLSDTKANSRKNDILNTMKGTNFSSKTVSPTQATEQELIVPDALDEIQENPAYNVLPAEANKLAIAAAAARSCAGIKRKKDISSFNLGGDILSLAGNSFSMAGNLSSLFGSSGFSTGFKLAGICFKVASAVYNVYSKKKTDKIKEDQDQDMGNSIKSMMKVLYSVKDESGELPTLKELDNTVVQNEEAANGSKYKYNDKASVSKIMQTQNAVSAYDLLLGSGVDIDGMLTAAIRANNAKNNDERGADDKVDLSKEGSTVEDYKLIILNRLANL